MSAIGGLYYFDDAPVDCDLLSGLGERLNEKGPDGGQTIAFNSIGMTYRAFHTNPESRLQSQPLVSPYRQLLTWDGRLDNREDVITALGSDAPCQITHLSDACLVMITYRRWSIDFLTHLIGDYAFSLWDPLERMLLLARDPIGSRTLFYHTNKRGLFWSTDLQSLIDLNQIPLEINDEYIADLLARLPDPSHTPYCNIFAVPPGSMVIAQNRQIRIKRFWTLSPRSEIRYSTDAEYEEHFLHLFREAVRCRLRVDGSVWAQLSGGLDSSSIVCMADNLIKSGHSVARELHTVSLVFDQATESDERKYIRAVENKIGKTGLHLREDDYPFLTAPADNRRPIIPNPVSNFEEYYLAADEVILQSGGRVLLSGKGGDEVLSAACDPAPELADLMLHLQLKTLHRRLNIWSQVLKTPYSKLLWEKTILPCLHPRLRTVFANKTIREIVKLYDERFADRMDIRKRLLGPTDAFGHTTVTGREHAVWFLRIIRELAAGFWQDLCRVEFTYPFLHLPLVEFLHSIPFEQRVRPEATRSLLRRSLRNLLPDEIVNRKGKTINSDALLRAVTREASRLEQLFVQARVVGRGYINPETMLTRLADAKQHGNPFSLTILPLVPLEYWLRSVESRKAKETQSERLVQSVSSEPFSLFAGKKCQQSAPINAKGG